MTTFHTGLAPTSRSPLGSLAARLARRFAARRTRRATAEDLSQLSDRTLADIGLSRDDVPGMAARSMRDHATRLSLAL